jgi:ribonuclease HI
MKRLDLYIDGASKGNPGPSGIGVIVCQDGEVIRNVWRFIGEATNNVAEYTALLYGLQEALGLRAEAIHIYTDSELLYKQANRQYKIKSPQIIGLFEETQQLMKEFKEVCVTHIPRENNKGADKLANRAIREAAKV